jgi:hypothetical protein
MLVRALAATAGPVRPSTRPMPLGQSGPNACQLGDLARGPGARLGYRGHDAVVEEIGEQSWQSRQKQRRHR